MTRTMDRVRIATVHFTNAWPLTARLDHTLFQVFHHHPAEAARLLREGEVDLALLPVASVLTDGDYRIVPGVCIGADGPVESVLLVSEVPPEEWEVLALDGCSRSSAVLAELLVKQGPLSERVSDDLTIFRTEPGKALEHAVGKGAALIIGDPARELPERLAHRIDLAEAWKAWTGLPFVFAVWAGRPDLDSEVIDELRRVATEGLALREGLPEPDRTYLTESVKYDLDDRMLSGLRRYAALGSDAGLLGTRDVILYGPQPSAYRRTDLDTLLCKGAEGERLSSEEALRLHLEAPIADLGAAANLRRWAMHPTDEVTYIISRNINYTNVCVTACKFCAFYRPERHREAYVLTEDQVRQKCQELVDRGGVEVLLQGGLHRKLGIEYYEELFRFIKGNFPLNLHALSPEEIFHIMKISELSMEETMERLAAAGMDSLPGGGAEVLVDEVRKKIAPLKCSTDEWLEAMRMAHKMGMTSSSTLMFGMQETAAHRVEHLMRLRELQDETGGFIAFICWTFQPENTYVKPGANTAADYLRVNALSRLVLDNFSNLQASWVTQGPGVAQASLHMGCNDFGSVMLEENVVSAAGTTFAMDVADVERNIRQAGFVPVRRNASYDHVGQALTRENGRRIPAPAK